MPIRDDSAGSYGQWNSDDLSWLDFVKAKGSDIGGGAYNALANLSGALSPIGTSEQGNMAFQVPPMVTGLSDSLGRLVGTPNEPGNAWNLSGVEELDAPILADGSNVLLSFAGANAFNPLALKPRGSLGAGAMREGEALPMDHASRMARANDLGYTTRVYRGQKTATDEMKPDTFWADDQRVADHYASRWQKTKESSQIPTERSLLDKLLGRHPTRDYNWESGYTTKEGTAVYDGLLNTDGFLDVDWSPGGGAREYNIGLHQIIDDNPDVPGVIFRNIREPDVEAKFNEFTSGVEIPHTQYFVRDPSRARSINAAFDPSRIGENGLLLSDTGRPSIFGSAAATAGEQQNIPDWLRF